MANINLYGYRYSVYTRIVRLVLQIKEQDYDSIEVDPFSALPPGYLDQHPFGRVPVLTHGTFSIFETQAITRYLDSTFPANPLMPETAKARARVDQTITIIDNYGYLPMVRQVFSNRVFAPLEGAPVDEAEISMGLEASHKVLESLERFAKEGLILNGQGCTLADCHLAPMIDYFVRAEEGHMLLRAYPALNTWWDGIQGAGILTATDPDLSLLGPKI